MVLSTLVALAALPTAQDPVKPVRSELVQPIRNASFNKGGKAKKRVQGGNPRQLNGYLVFDGALDGNRQVDPQIAVGGGYVFHGTNSGFTIYDKEGNYVDGVPQSEFNGGIDPKMFFDVNNRVFGFDLWNPWDKEKLKPVNISISETDDPRGAWNTYPVPAPGGVDGGAIGHSKKWLGYSFPGGDDKTFVMKMEDVIAGEPATAYHFKGTLGLPAFNQDESDDLIFVSFPGKDILITTVGAGADGTPVVTKTVKAPHGIKYFGWPPSSPMKGTDKKTASGDRRPKNLVVQNGCIWFSHTVNVEGRAGVQWHQVKLDGTFVQSGRVAHKVNSFIETTIGVNKNEDVVVGFQETGPEMFISARFGWRKSGDGEGLLRRTVKFGEGVAATEGGAWGDYSGTCVDGDNLTDIWTVQSVANEKGRGSMVIAKIPF
jgi:hypothetical protein